MNLPLRRWRWVGSAQPRAGDTWMLAITLCRFEYRLTAFIPKWRIVVGWQYLLVWPETVASNGTRNGEPYQYGD